MLVRLLLNRDTIRNKTRYRKSSEINRLNYTNIVEFIKVKPVNAFQLTYVK